jgi:hypothetical protein
LVPAECEREVVAGTEDPVLGLLVSQVLYVLPIHLQVEVIMALHKEKSVLLM